jgi:hypothetical protein
MNLTAGLFHSLGAAFFAGLAPITPSQYMARSQLLRPWTLACFTLIGFFGCVNQGELRSYKKYLQDVERVVWLPDGDKILFDYKNQKNSNTNDLRPLIKTYTYLFDIKSKKLSLVNHEGFCGIYQSNQKTKMTYPKDLGNTKYHIFERYENEDEQEVKTPYFFGCGLFINQDSIFFLEDTLHAYPKKISILDRSKQTIYSIQGSKELEEFIQGNDIPDYSIKSIYKINEKVRILIEGRNANKIQEADINSPSFVTYASALIENNQIIQIEKIDQINPEKEEIHFFGLQSENQLIYAKNPRNQPPLTYYEYNFSTHGSSIRSEMNKINQLVNDGRYIVPLAFSPNFKEMVYIVAINTDQERNPIQDFIHFNLSTGEKRSLFNIYETLPKGDFKYGL